MTALDKAIVRGFSNMTKEVNGDKSKNVSSVVLHINMLDYDYSSHH